MSLIAPIHGHLDAALVDVCPFITSNRETVPKYRLAHVRSSILRSKDSAIEGFGAMNENDNVLVDSVLG